MSSINDALRKAGSDSSASTSTQLFRSQHRPPSRRRSLMLWGALGLVALFIIVGFWFFRPDNSITTATVKTTEGSTTQVKPAVRPGPGPDQSAEAQAAQTEVKPTVLDQPQSNSLIAPTFEEEIEPSSVPDKTQSTSVGQSAEKPVVQAQAATKDDVTIPQETAQSVREPSVASQAEEQQMKPVPEETKQPTTAEEHFQKARTAQEQGRDSQAVHYYRQALLLDPNLSEAYLNLGNIYFYRHRALEKALDMYTQVLKLDPNNEMAHNNLGVLFLRRGMLGQAETEFYAALQENPGYVDALYNLACLSALKNETDTALEYLARAAAIQPETVVWAAGDEDLKNLRRLPRFQTLLQETQAD